MIIIYLFIFSRGIRSEGALVPPIRQTASIFKQPVTVHKNQEGKVKTDFKHGRQEKPRQVNKHLLFSILYITYKPINIEWYILGILGKKTRRY